MNDQLLSLQRIFTDRLFPDSRLPTWLCMNQLKEEVQMMKQTEEQLDRVL